MKSIGNLERLKWSKGMGKKYRLEEALTPWAAVSLAPGCSSPTLSTLTLTPAPISTPHLGLQLLKGSSSHSVP